jgi:hypothetical protein
MKFFKFDSKENKLDLVREDLLLVDCFDKLFKQDKTKDKRMFWSYCKYLYLVYDNDSFLVKAKKKIDERIEKSKQYVKLTDNDLQSPLYKECEKEYMYWNYTMSMEIRDGNITTMANIDKYSKNADLEAVDKKGELLHDITKIAKARTDLVKLAHETKQLEQMIELELEEKGKARGGKLTTPHEEGVLDKMIADLTKNR